MQLDKKDVKFWSIEIGFYPGVLLGIRTYYEEEQTTHVLYIPFMDVAVTFYKE